MTKEEYAALIEIADGKGWEARQKLAKYLQTVTPGEETPQKRTGAQHRALFLWYGMIEKICENEGVTWDRLIKHTHQLKVTKENLHEAGKQLQKALWGKYSTKELEKNQIDKLTEHFIEWFAKEGVELPEFPSDQSRVIDRHFTRNTVQYPEYEKAPDFEAQNSI